MKGFNGLVSSPKVLPSISKPVSQDYAPKTELNHNIPTEDGLTHEEKTAAITRLSRNDRCKTSEGEHLVELSTKVFYKDGRVEQATSRVEFTFGWICQAGFYPENLNKPNQDNLMVLNKTTPLKFTSSNKTIEYEEKDFALFAVFDGHGQFGTECASFAASSFPRLFSTFVSECNNLISRNELKSILTKTLEQINVEMHKQKHARKQPFNDLCSGTTAICVLLLDDEVVTANVGDSRALLGLPSYKNSENKLSDVKILPLSVDQTPFRKDERDRCKASGGVVMSMDQMEGLIPFDPNQETWGSEEDAGIDPPRLWSTQPGSPGVAFTRSLGDAFVEQIGCIATPEISSFSLPLGPSFVCAASDGVFEFLNSEAVSDILAQFQARHLDQVQQKKGKSGVYDAAKALIAEAYKLWLHYEVRTDDITAIVTFIHSIESVKDRQTIKDVSWRMSVEQRPVRRVISKEKRKLLRPIELHEDESDDELDLPKIPKTLEEKQAIRDAIKTNFLFQHLTQTQIEKVLERFQKVEVSEGSVVIRQGEKGDKFYIVFDGLFDCFVSQDPSEKSYGQIVHQYDVTSKHSKLGKPSFGELALMFSEPRAATIVAKTAGVLYALNRKVFRRLFVRKTSNHAIVCLLRNVPIFQSLSKSQLQRLADVISLQSFQNGEAVITQGSLGDALYIVKSGSVRCVIDFLRPPYDGKGANVKDGNSTKEVMRISPGGYFGERALLYHEPRAASVFAVDSAEVLCLSRMSFEKLLGPLQTVIQRHSKLREQKAFAHKCMKANRERILGSIGRLGFHQFFTLSTVANSLESEIGVSFKQATLIKSKKTITLKSISIAFAEEHKLQESIERDRFLHSLCVTETHPGTPVGEEPSIDINFPYSFIGRLLGSFIAGKELYLVLQVSLIGSLYDLVSDSPECRLSERSVCFICANLINGLLFLHSRSILSRAINLSSLQLDEAGVIILGDLSMGRYLEDEFDRAHTMCGDKAYFAPEQILNKGADRSVDWWSLGLLLFELLYARLPYVEDGTPDDMSDSQRFKLITSFDPCAVEFGETLSAEGAETISSLLEPDYEKRSFLENSIKECTWLGKFSFDANEIEGYARSPLFSWCEKRVQIVSQNQTPIDDRNDSTPMEVSEEVWYHNFGG